MHIRFSATQWAILFAGLMVLSWVCFFILMQLTNFRGHVIEEQTQIINGLSQALQDRNAKPLGPVY